MFVFFLYIYTIYTMIIHYARLSISLINKCLERDIVTSCFSAKSFDPFAFHCHFFLLMIICHIKFYTEAVMELKMFDALL